MASLFRKQALEAQSHRLMGSITLNQPISLKVTIFILSTIFIISIFFVINAEYARKETVIGFLQPDKGEIKSYSSQAGTVKEVLVSAGDIVTMGDPLISIVNNRSLENGKNVRKELIDELKTQVRLLHEDKKQLRFFEQQSIKSIDKKLVVAFASLDAVKRRHDLNQSKIQILAKQRLQLDKLYRQGYLSELSFHQHQEKQISAKQESENIVGAILRVEGEIAELEARKKLIPQEYIVKERQFVHKLSQLKTQLTETSTNYSHVVKATHTGKVTDIHVLQGEILNTVRPLLTILPTGSKLVAELMLPTRSAGFIEKGNIAYLRFDAFPHQRFGFVKSKVSRIDNTLINQKDVNFPVEIPQSVYRVQAILDKQFILGNGREFPLKSGMLLNADIVLDKRSLLDWIIDPILSIKGQLR